MTGQNSRSLVLVVSLGLAVWAVRAQDQTPEPPTSPAPRSVDQTVHAVLKDVINRGAELYNPPAYDRAGCYRLYQGSLLVTRPLLGHRPELQQAIDESLTDAEKEPKVGERAFILRAVIDRIRAETGPRKDSDRPAGKRPLALKHEPLTSPEPVPAAVPGSIGTPAGEKKPVAPKPAEAPKPEASKPDAPKPEASKPDAPKPAEPARPATKQSF